MKKRVRNVETFKMPTEFEMEEFRKKQEDGAKAMLLRSEYRIGRIVGELIWATSMPTLSSDYVQSGKVISVSDSDLEEYKKAHDEWWNYTKELPSDKKDEKSTNLFNIQLAEYKKIEEKYLPKEYKFHIDVPIDDNEDFRKGLINSLWNSDGCHYSLKDENIKISREDYYTYISFQYEP